MKINKRTKIRYEEIRDYDGHSSRGTGEYKSVYYDVYFVGRKDFDSIKSAKRYIKYLKNKSKIMQLKRQAKLLRKQEAELNKKQRKLANAIYALGGN